MGKGREEEAEGIKEKVTGTRREEEDTAERGGDSIEEDRDIKEEVEVKNRGARGEEDTREGLKNVGTVDKQDTDRSSATHRRYVDTAVDRDIERRSVAHR
jgi:hypothetical protein